MVRLLNINTLDLHEFTSSGEIPPYVVASHRWLEKDKEATFQDVRARRNTNSPGYLKIKAFCEYVKKMPGSVNFPWLWIDTCCIDKSSSAELAEAINSMFKWYMNAFFCLAYLQDVTTTSDEAELESSVWFKRGWTLQELLAPHVVIFLDKEWQTIGHKQYTDSRRLPEEISCGPCLNSRLARTTGIPEEILEDFDVSVDVSNEEKKSWLSDRSTTRREDMAYCMLGLLGISMPPIYGEGRSRSWRRLEMELQRQKEIKSGYSSADTEAPYVKLLGSRRARPTRPTVRMSAVKRSLSVSSRKATTEVGDDLSPSTTDTSTGGPTRAEWQALYSELVAIRKLLEKQNETHDRTSDTEYMKKSLEELKDLASGKRGPTMRSKEHDDEEEQLRLDIGRPKSYGREADRYKPSPEPPIRFKDAVGRKFSFPWHICKTWKGMEGLIKQAFLHVDIIGEHVHQGHYDLTNPEGEIILPQVWDVSVKPDWEITMALWPMEDYPPPPLSKEVGDPMVQYGSEAIEGHEAMRKEWEEIEEARKADWEWRRKGKSRKKVTFLDEGEVPPPPPPPGPDMLPYEVVDKEVGDLQVVGKQRSLLGLDHGKESDTTSGDETNQSQSFDESLLGKGQRGHPGKVSGESDDEAASSNDEDEVSSSVEFGLEDATVQPGAGPDMEPASWAQ